jgi:hypothetical protein
MNTVKKGYEAIENWNLKAKSLVKDLENTIEGVSRLLSGEKENVEPKTRGVPVKAFEMFAKERKRVEKAEPSVVKNIIRAGIYNLRKSASPAPASGRNTLGRSTSIETPRRPPGKHKSQTQRIAYKKKDGRGRPRSCKKEM